MFCSSAAAGTVVRKLGRESTILQADLLNDDDVTQLFDDAVTWRDGIDYWVNNAGGDVLTTAESDWTFEEKLDFLYRIDLRAAVRLSRLVGARMQTEIAQEDEPTDRSILNIGWDQAWQGMAGDSGEMFAAVKGSVMSFTLSLARSLAPSVRVNCIAPGWIRTSWGEQASDYWQQRAVQESLVQRWGTPEDIAATARFLLSPAASFITGHVIPVNGGFRVRE